MNKELALQVVTELANASQKHGILTLDDAVKVKQVLEFIAEEFAKPIMEIPKVAYTKDEKPAK